VNRLVFHPGPVLILFGLVRVVLGVVIAIVLFYVLVKLAGLAQAMTEAKRAATRSAAFQTEATSTRAKVLK